MNLKVVRHAPDNEVEVLLNEPLKIYFNKPIDPLTIKWDTLSINDSYSFSTVVGNMGPIWESGVNLSGVTSGVVFQPTLNLLPNTEYSVYVYGAPNSILGTDGSELKETYSYSFVTGTGYYDVSGNIGTPTGTISGVTSITLSGIPLVYQDDITAFKVYSTNPKHQQPNVDMTIHGIYVTFTGNVLTDLNTLSGYITVEETPVIG